MLLPILDPNFLDPTAPDMGYTFPTGGEVWTYSTHNVLVSSTDCTLFSPTLPSGGQTQCCLLQSAGNIGSASQTIDFGAGGACTFSGLATQINSGQAGILDVLIDSDVVYTLTPGTSWAEFASDPFTVSPGSHLLTVAAHAQGGDNSFVLTGLSVDLTTTTTNTIGRPPKWCAARPSRHR